MELTDKTIKQLSRRVLNAFLADTWLMIVFILVIVIAVHKLLGFSNSSLSLMSSLFLFLGTTANYRRVLIKKEDNLLTVKELEFKKSQQAEITRIIWFSLYLVIYLWFTFDDYLDPSTKLIGFYWLNVWDAVCSSVAVIYMFLYIKKIKPERTLFILKLFPPILVISDLFLLYDQMFIYAQNPKYSLVLLVFVAIFSVGFNFPSWYFTFRFCYPKKTKGNIELERFGPFSTPPK